MLTSWQRVLLVICSMAMLLVCRLSRACGDNPASIEHFAYVVIGFVSGVTMPGMVAKAKENNEQA